MKNLIEYKTGDFKTLDVDAKARRVKNAYNRVEVKDTDKDIVEAGAFTKTIKERGPKASNLIWHLTDHTARLTSAVGKFTELYMDADGYLVGITDVPKTTWGNDVLEHYERGNINQHSIGFSIVKSQRINENDPANEYRRIQEVLLWEGSTVLWGANEDTPNFSVGKSLSFEECVQESEKYLVEMEKLSSSLRNGKYSDECFELLQLKVLQMRTKAAHIFESLKQSTQPATQSVEPVQDKEEFKRKLLLINSKLSLYAAD